MRQIETRPDDAWCSGVARLRAQHQVSHYHLRGRVSGMEYCFLLPLGESRVGRSPVNDLVIPVPEVSRRHARLNLGMKRVELEDLNSRNGTFVNGERVGHRDIRAGDTLYFGSVALRLEEIDADDGELGMVFEGPSAAHFPPNLDPTTEIPTVLAGFREAETPALVFPAKCVPGRSAAMVRLYLSMQPLLEAELPVLIEGETGAGKEFVARTLHLSSNRRDEPFVAVNCAAIPADLLEAEMFGIGQGVATGVHKRPGKFRSAQGGTLFLDEIGAMPLELQSKLLRALQEKEIQPLGDATIPVDVQVTAATNTDLLKRVDDGWFRRDLYYRVAGCLLKVPPLRERLDDIPLLLEHFLQQAAGKAGKKVRGLTVRALLTLKRYPWPGNVRELEYEARRLACLCAGGQVIDSGMLSEQLLHPRPGRKVTDAGTLAEPPPPELPKSGSEGTCLRLADYVREAERRAIRLALKHARGSQRQAARLLGISRNTLIRKIRQLGIPT